MLQIWHSEKSDPLKSLITELIKIFITTAKTKRTPGESIVTADIVAYVRGNLINDWKTVMFFLKALASLDIECLREIQGRVDTLINSLCQKRGKGGEPIAQEWNKIKRFQQ